MRKSVILAAALATPAILLSAAVPAFAQESSAPAAANGRHLADSNTDGRDGPDGSSTINGMPSSHNYSPGASDDYGSDDYGNDSYGGDSYGGDSYGGDNYDSSRNFGGGNTGYNGGGYSGSDGTDGVTHGKLPLLGG